MNLASQLTKELIQERPTQIYANFLLYTKNKLLYQVRANTFDFCLSGQYGKYNSNICLFHPLGPLPSKMMCCP